MNKDTFGFITVSTWIKIFFCVSEACSEGLNFLVHFFFLFKVFLIARLAIFFILMFCTYSCHFNLFLLRCVCVYVSMYVLLIFLYTCIYKFLFRKGQAAFEIYPVTSVRNWAIISLLLYNIIGNPQLIIVSTHHPWVKWQRYLCSHVIVLKHADKSRRLSL